MNRFQLSKTIPAPRSMQIQAAFAIFFATAIHTSFLKGQEDRAFAHIPGMVMLDNSIPDFVAMTKLEGIFGNKEKAFGYLMRAQEGLFGNPNETCSGYAGHMCQTRCASRNGAAGSPNETRG